tara:strand:- start:224 stop:1282 length:1059 start_codon:yes stop_codon:yes gene_type:complete
LKQKILISTGGSGGHVKPAIALYEHLNERFDVIYSTDIRGKKFFEDVNDYFVIDTPKLKNKFLFPLNILIILYLTIRSLLILQREKVEYLFSTGGYMSIPLCLASKFLKIDIYLIEPNMVLGRANKFFLSFSKKIFCYSKNIKNYPSKYLNKQIIINPIVRKKFFDDNLELNRTKKFSVMIVGGSQGATIFDKYFNEAFKNINDTFPLKIFHQTSEDRVNDLKNFYLENSIENYVFSYDENLLRLIQKSDLCITRAGASTISELTILNVPFLTIPLPNSKDNHQLENAIFYKDKGYCWILNQEELNQKKIEEFFINIFKNRQEYENKKLGMKTFKSTNSWINDNGKILHAII